MYILYVCIMCYKIRMILQTDTDSLITDKVNFQQTVESQKMKIDKLKVRSHFSAA